MSEERLGNRPSGRRRSSELPGTLLGCLLLLEKSGGLPAEHLLEATEQRLEASALPVTLKESGRHRLRNARVYLERQDLRGVLVEIGYFRRSLVRVRTLPA